MLPYILVSCVASTRRQSACAGTAQLAAILGTHHHVSNAARLHQDETRGTHATHATLHAQASCARSTILLSKHAATARALDCSPVAGTDSCLYPWVQLCWCTVVPAPAGQRCCAWPTSCGLGAGARNRHARTAAPAAPSCSPTTASGTACAPSSASWALPPGGTLAQKDIACCQHCNMALLTGFMCCWAVRVAAAVRKTHG